MNPTSVPVASPAPAPESASASPSARAASRRLHLPWPLPAVLVWLGAWALWLALSRAGLAPAWAFGLALGASSAAAWRCGGAWRRGIAAAGFPLSALALGAAAAVPPWIWLVLLLPVLALYPLRAWRDAPLFPTPRDALLGLDDVVGTPTRVLDAGCGVGDGLLALHRLWPRAHCTGFEWSLLLALATRWRCRVAGLPAGVRRGDMWAASWSGYDLVYLFQRPESMARAYSKASAELAPGAWLVSLEFPVPGVVPKACLQGAGRKPVWVYQPLAARLPQYDRHAADNSPMPATGP